MYPFAKIRFIVVKLRFIVCRKTLLRMLLLMSSLILYCYRYCIYENTDLNKLVRTGVKSVKAETEVEMILYIPDRLSCQKLSKLTVETANNVEFMAPSCIVKVGRLFALKR